jgi:hypothetical protein
VDSGFIAGLPLVQLHSESKQCLIILVFGHQDSSCKQLRLALGRGCHLRLLIIFWWVVVALGGESWLVVAEELPPCTKLVTLLLEVLHTQSLLEQEHPATIVQLQPS